MGVFGYLVTKGIETAAAKTVIDAAGVAASAVASAVSQAKAEKDAMVQNGVLYVYPSRNSEDYGGEDAVAVVNELLGCGFEKVELKANKSLGSFGRKKYGKIQRVLINGASTFMAKRKVLSSAYVVVEYFDFKDSVDPSVLKKVKLIRPGIYESIVSEEAFAAHTESPGIGDPGTGTGDPDSGTPGTDSFTTGSTRSSAAKYCMFCGKKIEDLDARYCSECGRAFI